MQALLALGGGVIVVSAILAAMGFRGREQVVGIDLGTTFSVVAIRQGDKVTVLPDRFTGKLLVPSVVSYLENGTAVVGDAAVALRATRPLHTVFNAKRFIGSKFGNVAHDASMHPYQVAPNVTATNLGLDAKDVAAGFVIPEKENEATWVSPITIGAEIVKHMKESITEFIGYPIGRAVICVPAKFGPNQTHATKLAFEKAGFKVMRVMDEPTAAAVAYNLHKGSKVRHVLVYDLGGGTLDTSMLFMNGKSVSVLGVAGDDRLGGSDFDHRMVDILLEKLKASTPSSLRVATSDTPPNVEPCTKDGLHVAGERAKCALSSSTTADVLCKAEGGSIRTLTVTRQEFEKASEDLFLRALDPVKKVLEDQVMEVHHVDDIVLVGGATRMPRVRTMLQDFFGPDQKLHTEIDPDVTIAFGAANIVD